MHHFLRVGGSILFYFLVLKFGKWHNPTFIEMEHITMIWLILAQLFVLSSAKSADFVNTLPLQYFVPCTLASRNCYPGLEYCYDNNVCLLKEWIACTLVFIGYFVLLLITLALYFAFEERSKLIRVGIVVCGVLSFAFFLAMIVLAATDDNNLVSLSDA